MYPTGKDQQPGRQAQTPPTASPPTADHKRPPQRRSADLPPAGARSGDPTCTLGRGPAPTRPLAPVRGLRGREDRRWAGLRRPRPAAHRSAQPAAAARGHRVGSPGPRHAGPSHQFRCLRGTPGPVRPAGCTAARPAGHLGQRWPATAGRQGRKVSSRPRRTRPAHRTVARPAGPAGWCWHRSSLAPPAPAPAAGPPQGCHSPLPKGRRPPPARAPPAAPATAPQPRPHQPRPGRRSPGSC